MILHISKELLIQGTMIGWSIMMGLLFLTMS